LVTGWSSLTTPDGRLQGNGDWQVIPTRVGRGASIGSHATLLPGIVVGEHALVGAGSVVTRDVPEYAVVVGVPARVVGSMRDIEECTP
jgi:acetyltransferase-like isoleucine patch superfamily enzyme